MAERCRQKRGVKFSVVFVTVSFRIVLSVFGEKAESNLTFSAKTGFWTGKKSTMPPVQTLVCLQKEKKKGWKITGKSGRS
jgi:hypothetical protein